MPDIKNDMTIAKLARAAEVGVETVRYYQRRGLLPVPRAGGQKGKAPAFRHYDQAHVQTLRFIRRAQAAGFTLEEIKELLALDRTRARARYSNDFISLMSLVMLSFASPNSIMQRSL